MALKSEAERKIAKVFLPDSKSNCLSLEADVRGVQKDKQISAN